MDNILHINNHIYLANMMSEVFKRKRLLLNITQADLSKQAGVSLGSLKRFEGSSEISLKNLLKLAVILDLAEYFYNITSIDDEQVSIKEIMKTKNQRKRASKND
jgi:transcriptional regulator with XRE-family HTH domain